VIAKRDRSRILPVRELPERLLLIDPTTPPSPIAALAAERETVVVLTCPWHERDTRSLVAQVGASVFSPPSDSPGDDPLTAQIFTAGARLPVGVEAHPGMEPDDLVLWIEGLARARRRRHPHRPRQGLRVPADWANKGVPPALILETLRPLLELPVAFVLPTHGPPASRADLERALS
jgi:hypothetical protein